MQTSAEEVKFRWSGLTKWLSRGLTFWWFDANWAFSVPPPNVKYGGSGDGADWDGMSNRVWGSHLYYTTVEVYNKMNPTRAHTMPLDRPMVLTKYADGNMHPGLVQHQHPAQHRYPVWWTGDGVDLQASVQSMVDSGVYDFKPYVHSDCGGDYRGKVGGDLMRWAAHCAFGTIHRFHGSDHIPWSYDDHTTDVIRSYLKMRYALLPSLIAAGHSATFSGFPLVARCDVLYPTHAADGASSNEQYLFLNDTLVAPIWDSSKNLTSQSVWVPPGAWKDAWSGDVVTGPKMMTVQQPYERIPMWHRSGGLVVLADDRAALRVDDQDWSTLVLDAHAHGVDASSSSSTTTTTRVVRERGDATTAETPATTITMRLASNKLTFSISSADNGAERAWVLRVHLPVGRRVTRAIVDGREVAATHLAPLSVDDGTFTPFGGRGARPPVRSGHVAELQIPRSSSPRAIALEY
jgi:alpha-glucosidase (family GH31 glycosyl hydrolase)